MIYPTSCVLSNCQLDSKSIGSPSMGPVALRQPDVRKPIRHLGNEDRIRSLLLKTFLSWEA